MTDDFTKDFRKQMELAFTYISNNYKNIPRPNDTNPMQRRNGLLANVQSDQKCHAIKIFTSNELSSPRWSGRQATRSYLLFIVCNAAGVSLFGDMSNSSSSGTRPL